MTHLARHALRAALFVVALVAAVIVVNCITGP